MLASTSQSVSKIPSLLKSVRIRSYSGPNAGRCADTHCMFVYFVTP